MAGRRRASRRSVHVQVPVAPPAEVAVSAVASVHGTAYSEEGSVSLPENVCAAIYARVSTEDQDLAGQERELRNECLRRGWDIAAVYEEKISATGRVERKEYERVLADARAPDRSWDHLLVWSLDRWSREERFSRAVATIEDLESLGVRFHSLREPMLDSGEDGSANMGRDLLRAILPVIAAFESRRKSERVRVAMQELKSGRRRTRTGRPVGRPRRVTPALVERAELLRRQGVRWSEIAQRVGLPAGTCRSMVWKAKRAVGGV
jgi:DNA invertase Pin-like site-specific DNA recombinase